MTRETSHFFFGAITAVLLAVGLAALVLMAFAASAADAQSSKERQPAQEAEDKRTDQAKDKGTGQAEDEGTKPSVGSLPPLKYVMSCSTSDNKRPGAYKAVAQCPASYQAISGGFDLHLKSIPSVWTLRASRPATAEEAISQTAWEELPWAKTVRWSPAAFSSLPYQDCWDVQLPS